MFLNQEVIGLLMVLLRVSYGGYVDLGERIAVCLNGERTAFLRKNGIKRVLIAMKNGMKIYVVDYESDNAFYTPFALNPDELCIVEEGGLEKLERVEITQKGRLWYFKHPEIYDDSLNHYRSLCSALETYYTNIHPLLGLLD